MQQKKADIQTATATLSTNCEVKVSSNSKTNTKDDPYLAMKPSDFKTLNVSYSKNKVLLGHQSLSNQRE